MAAIFDLDNTLVINGVQPNASVIRECNSTPDAYIITGRLESERASTEALLHKMGVKYAGLLMNDIDPDKQSQMASKKLNAKKILAHGPVELAVDDNALARAMYKNIGVQTVKGP